MDISIQTGWRQLLAGLVCLTGSGVLATEATADVEVLRLNDLITSHPELLDPSATITSDFSRRLKTVATIEQLYHLVEEAGRQLWSSASSGIKSDQLQDDRPLYWGRLMLRNILEENTFFRGLSADQQQQITWQLELTSRGRDDVMFSQDSDYKILLTGFDPFFLDRHLNQSNPSGATAQVLDGEVISHNGKTAEIQSLIFPVVYADFDQGMVETLLSPWYNKVDMVVTVSMGRKDFDLERFPGLRRSAKAPDNMNVFTGATAERPLVPQLEGKPLKGPEFVEFSLPVLAMQQAKGDFRIIDNHQVTSLEKGQHSPARLNELDGQTAVRGSGGGYLSNEISYRSVLLRNQLNPDLPVGHIHTPRIAAFEPDTTAKIIYQIRAMLTQAVEAL